MSVIFLLSNESIHNLILPYKFLWPQNQPQTKNGIQFSSQKLKYKEIFILVWPEKRIKMNNLTDMTPKADMQ